MKRISLSLLEFGSIGSLGFPCRQFCARSEFWKYDLNRMLVCKKRICGCDFSNSFSNFSIFQKRNYFVDPRKDSRNRKKKKKREFDIVLLIVIINGLVYLIFQLLSDEEKNKFVQNFAISLRNIREGKLYTLLTCNFLHCDFLHFALNLFVFYSFGRNVRIIMGRKKFMYLIALSCITSPVGFLAERYFYFKNTENLYLKSRHFNCVGYGLSGITMGIITASCLLMPHQQVLLYFVIPLNLRLAWFGLMGYDIYSMFTKSWRNSIASSSHIAGALPGLIICRRFLRNLLLPF